ncbi:MAG TPA: hypothetical protein VLJ86_06830 [Ramlibacter sp.]|nr:hypothetical protein [Ramlibacter sp.]
MKMLGVLLCGNEIAIWRDVQFVSALRLNFKAHSTQQLKSPQLRAFLIV